MKVSIVKRFPNRQAVYSIRPDTFASSTVCQAGEGNRTLVFSLEGYCSTIELHPQLTVHSIYLVKRSIDPFVAQTRILPNFKWGVKDSNL
jgi:hypothetical protein